MAPNWSRMMHANMRRAARNFAISSRIVVPGNRDGVPPPDLIAAVREDVGDQQQDRRWRIDGHQCRHLIERNLVEQDAHVIDRVDGDAYLADLTVGQRVVGVVAHLGRQVEGNRQPRSARGQQLPVPLIGRCGSPGSV